MNFNKAIVIGNLTRDPEARVVPESGNNISNFSVATNRYWTDQQGQKQEQTEFHNIVAFGRLAEICNQYLTKGQLICIEGRLQTRSWIGQQDGVKRYRTEIVANNMQMGPRPQGTGYTAPQGAAPQEEISVQQVQPESSTEHTTEPTVEPTTEETSVESSEKEGEEFELKNIPF